MNPENYQSDRQIVPSEHSPRKETHYAPQAMTDMIVEEVENQDAWISMDIEHTVEVRA